MITTVTVSWEHMATLDPGINVLDAIKTRFGIPSNAKFIRLETGTDEDCYYFVFDLENAENG